ncbi:hypothetical protein NLU13_3087 [Sarocladium strictum]|uniref:protein-tyrosine-phosphatase n=1 Tax=Sarocladium strictum TaxID=5046 RepID=A0AA39GLE3_SARSR|nr:hypothetical protein NLU13_3087 [Sarocladium strictum]
MPSAAARQAYEDQIPPFMTVFDLDAETMADQDTVTVVNPKMVDLVSKDPEMANTTQQPTLQSNALLTDPGAHKHTDSTSTQASESADSSPTTTFSTTDSSPLSDPSPSSSPDSPVHLIPLNNYPSTTFGTSIGSTTAATTLNSTVPELHPMSRPMTSPSPRKPRNLKGLSIQPVFSSSTATAAPLMEPCSPSFIKPQIPAMKRKPSQLSLKTNSSDLLKTTLEVPKPLNMPPILQRRALKHSTSSPHMLSTLKSASFGPPGGMSFPKVLERNENGLSEVLRPMKSSMNTNFDVAIAEEDSPIKPQMANRSDYEPYPEPGNNEDLKSPGYPDGPIAIYDDNVYLYLEPTAEEASRFDVVINVAREVKNPFKTTDSGTTASPALSQTSASEDSSPIPDTAVTTASFATAFEFQPSDDRWVETPTTPKANALQRPEYIHMEWDHNTDIAPDLKNLCETIDERTKEGKKVLVHCQQGASRSASLIIAYGLYQNPNLSVNDAYYAAQAKSRWISPNMKLMYSLQDFQKEISRKRTPLRSGRSPTKHRTTLSADAINLSAKEPQTAPLPSLDKQEEEKEEQRSPTRPRGNSTPLRPTAVVEAASMPRNFERRAPVEQSSPPPPPMPTPNFVDLPQRPKSGQGRTESGSQIESWFKPPPTPGFNSHGSFGFQTMSFPSFRDSVSSVKNEKYADSTAIERVPGSFPIDVEDEALMSPRAETMTSNPLHELPEVAGMRFVESPPTPVEGLFSPRASMFPRDPFTPFGRPEQVADPRSPPTKGETPIVRSIDDIL